MKLTIGERWHRDESGYVEELTVKGVESIKSPMTKGETVLPKDGDSEVKVRVINNISAKFFTTTMKLHVLKKNWTKGEADI